MPLRLTAKFFAREADVVARALVGCTLVRVLDGVRLAGRIVETEAYMGAADRASHAFGNRRTPRTEPMFGPPGLSYVYFTYGMHFCMNVSCRATGDPSAVLLRALEPTEGLDLMRRVRGAAVANRDLCRGPARLCKALAIDASMNAVDTLSSSLLWFEEKHEQPASAARVTASPRVGLGSKAEPDGWISRHLRFCAEGSAFVSRTPAPNSAAAPAFPPGGRLKR
ncbi:MAG: DNA-3-methyladenine glycosylase [Phycisphaerales bacterium]|nr:DNA-3-methyladenine glycosylase [Phycisphaerales bacterium]